MKTMIKMIVLLQAVFFIASCADNSEMLTVINPDGSCYREFYAKVDSAFLSGNIGDKHNPFPVEIDSAWNITCDSATRQASIRCHYRSVDDMAKAFKLKPSHSWIDLNVRYRFNKKFRWFYTYYEYGETYPKIETTFSSIERFMNEDEAGFWFTGQPDLTQGMSGVEMQDYTEQLTDKYNRWVYYNYWTALYIILVDHYQSLDLSISKDEFISRRDSLFDKIDFDDVTVDDNSYIAQRLDELLNTNTFVSFFTKEDSPMKDFGDSFWNQDFMKYLDASFTYKLVMPGKVLKADNAVNQNDTLLWRLTAYRMFPNDYTIEAQSRKTNVWAFIVTGIIILIAIVLKAVNSK